MSQRPGQDFRDSIGSLTTEPLSSFLTTDDTKHRARLALVQFMEDGQIQDRVELRTFAEMLGVMP